MKKIFILLMLLSIGLMGFSQKSRKKSPPPPPPVFKLQTLEDSLAYSIGILNFQNLNEELIKKYNLKISTETLIRGISDQSKDSSILKVEDANEFLGYYMMKKEGELAAEEEVAGKKFLEENKNKPGIIITPSGLQYEVISMGTGGKPLATDKVKVHYIGSLIDSTVFDSSVERGEPVVFYLNKVIPGWTEGLQLMPTGSKFRFYLPPDLGYGSRSAGPMIKPNSVLIFDVELINIEPSN